MQKVSSEASEIFDSLDSLKVASNTLMPPFKTKVAPKKEEILPKFPAKTTNKVYTQSQTILVSKALNEIKEPSDCGIREIISQKNDQL